MQESMPVTGESRTDGNATSSPDSLTRRVPGSIPGIAITAALIFSVAMVAGGWWLLNEWYGVSRRKHQARFSFEMVPGGFDSPVLRNTLIVFLSLSATYILIAWLLAQHTRIGTHRLALVGAVVAVMSVGAVMLYPVGALDVFNYMVELKLAFDYGENPYVTTFRQYEHDPYAKFAFMIDVTLFYGPAWLLSSGIPVLFTGFTDVFQTLLGLKMFHLALTLLTGALVWWAHRTTHVRWLAAALFVANPLVMFESVGNGHNDILLTFFLVGAMIALRRRSVLAGPLLALSALVKVYTGILLPLFIVIALKDRWGWRRIAVTVALTAATVAAVSAPYWDDGELIEGFQVGLEESQQMDHVSPYSLALQYAQFQYAEDQPDTDFLMSRPVHEIVDPETRDQIWNAFAAVLLVATLALAASAWKGRAPEIVAAETLLVLFLTTTNLYPWYLVPVFGLIALRPDRLSLRYMVIATTLGLVYYPMFVFAHYNTEWMRFGVHQFLAIFLTVPILVYLLLRTGSGALQHIPKPSLRKAPA